MGRARCVRRERQSRPGFFGPRRPAGPASSPTFPRFLSRLPLAALLIAGAAGVGSPAIAQTTYWSATLTADATSAGTYLGCDNNDPNQDNCSLSTALTDDDFTYESTTYTVHFLYWNSSTDVLSFGLSGLEGTQAKAALSSLALEVDGTDFLFSSASTAGLEVNWDYEPATDWVDGTMVALKLKQVPFGLVFTSTEVSVDEGSDASYGVRLAKRPSLNVTVNIASSDRRAVAVRPASLTFTPSNWNRAQTVTVTGVADDDRNNETVTLTHSGLDVETKTVEVSVDDRGVVDVAFSQDSVSVAEGGTATYTVELTAQPTSDRTVTVESSDIGAATVAPTSLTFTPSDWNVAQQVTVTGVGDGNDDDETVVLTHKISTVNKGTVAVTVQDNHANAANRPQLVRSMGDVQAQAGRPFRFVVRDGTFSDPDGDGLRYAAKQRDGSNLPSWLSFDSGTRTFSGTPSNADSERPDSRVYVRLTATDGNGGTANAFFAIRIWPDHIAPVLESVSETDGRTKIVLTYDEALDETSEPATGQFTIGGDSATVSSVDVTGRNVVLTLSTALSSAATVSYAVPGTNPIQDLQGNDAAAIDAQPASRYTISVRRLQSRVSEGGGRAGFEISLSPVPTDPNVVFFAHWQTVAGTAVSNWRSRTGRDYDHVGGTYAFGNNADNRPTHTVWVPILDDGLDEGNERFKLRIGLGFSAEQPNLLNPTSAPQYVKDLAVRIGTAEAQVTIRDNDSGPSVTLRAPGGGLGGYMSEGEGAGKWFDVYLLPGRGSVSYPVTVNYRVRALTAAEVTETGHVPATAGTDFMTETGTVTFNSGETKKSVTVDIPRTPELEPHEAFAVALSGPSSGLNIEEALAFYTIVDNPGPFKTRLRVQSGSDDPSETEAGGCRADLAVEFRDGNGDLAHVGSLSASDFAVENGGVGTPARDGDAWTVPATATQGFTGPMRVRLLAKAPDPEGQERAWEAAELVLEVASDTECPAVAPNALASLALDGLTLDPAFDAATKAYTASAAADTAQTTVTATAVYGSSEAAISPADADTEAEGHQVALAEGETEVAVTVTPGDGNDAQAYTVTVTRGAEAAPEIATTQVPADWGLVPSGLSAGDRFRLLIVTSTKRHARVNTARFYDAHVQKAVAAGHADIRAHSAAFRMLGCTSSVDARTNTETAWTAADGGVPVYWLGGARVADDYADLYDNGWASNAPRDESGAESSATKVFTGCAGDGTRGDALGTRWVDIGRPGTSGGELNSGTRTLRTLLRPLYGLSPVFEVASSVAPAPALTASLVDLPERHDGTTAFSFELRFSEDVPVLSYKTLRDAAFTVTDGRVTDVRRLAPQATDRNRRWGVTVEPDSSRDVVVTLPATTDCEAAGAVCLGDGRMLSASASATVPGPAPALTASLVDLPERHDGATAFSFELRFSENVPVLSYKTLRDAAFTVTGGEVTGVRRLAPQAADRNRRWEITVEPDSFRDVAVTLPATTDCEAAGAVCHEDGRMLSGAASATVPGPALSVADAEAEEGTDDTLDFSVTLVPARTVPVTVAYATADVTATAGSDYTATSGTLTFAAGETEKTVAVPVLVDDVDEGSETLTLTLSNAQGAAIADGEATGTIANNGPIPEAWLARFGRTVTGQVLDAVEARLAAPRTPGAEMSLAGQGLPSWTAGGSAAATDDGEAAAAAAQREEAEARRALASMTAWLAQTGPEGRGGSGSGTGFGPDVDATGREPESRTLTQRDFITGTSFALTGGSAEGGGFASLWGRGSVAGFDGREGSLAVDGEVTTGLIGADWASAAGSESGAGSWTAGLALGHSTGTGGWRRGGGCDLNCGGAIEATLSGLYPYAGVDLTDRLSVWAAAGWGAGEVTVTPDGRAGLTADLSMSMGAAGARSDVLAPEGGEGLALAVKGDARFTRTSSDAVRGEGGNLAASDADVWLLRTGVEGSRPVALGEDGDSGATLTPSFELGLRLDGGDAETGMGADLGGGITFADPANGVALDAKARGLVAHESPGFREWGASLAASWDPRPATDRGLALTLRQTWGASPAGGMDALLGRETLADLAANDEDGGGRLRGIESPRGRARLWAARVRRRLHGHAQRRLRALRRRGAGLAPRLARDLGAQGRPRLRGQPRRDPHGARE